MKLADVAAELIDFCYPLRCMACAEPVEGAAARGQSDLSLCDKCGIALASIESAAACDFCGMPSAEPNAPCTYCLGKGVPHFERVIRLGAFHDPLKHLIHQMKYHRRWPIAQTLAKRMLASPKVRRLLDEADVLVPVPLHPLRQIARGYNQADVIADTVAGRRKVVHALARVRRTPMQTSMTSATKREENMREAFALVTDRNVRGKRVLLVDDVMTTGATLQSAARTLHDARPASLSALVIAVADPKHQDFQAI